MAVRPFLFLGKGIAAADYGKPANDYGKSAINYWKAGTAWGRVEMGYPKVECDILVAFKSFSPSGAAYC